MKHVERGTLVIGEQRQSGQPLGRKAARQDASLGGQETTLPKIGIKWEFGVVPIPQCSPLKPTRFPEPEKNMRFADELGFLIDHALA